MEFLKYFGPATKPVLDNIRYETCKMDVNGLTQMKMNCRDTVLAQLLPGGVKINFNREVKFDPEGPFDLSVTFTTVLPFNTEFSHEIDWKSVDIAGEFRRSRHPMLSVMMGRASLLIGEITSASGNNPLITPPNPQNGDTQ